MGTYGVTHVKKDNQIIALSDSYDGYMGNGMGQSNIICIKYLSTPILKKLFDQYTASPKININEAESFEDNNDDSTEVSPTQRQIQEALFKVREDTKDTQTIEWMTDTLNHQIRASIVGFAPLMYLNINNHYGRDYDYYNYLVDLDTETFNFRGASIPFDKIRNASINKIDAFCSELTELLPEELQDEDFSIFDEDYEGPEYDMLIAKFNKVMDAYFNLDDTVVDAYYHAKNEEINGRMPQDKEESALIESQERDSENEHFYGGYSIHSADVSPTALRGIVTLMQKLNLAIPKSEFLSKTSDWGINPEYTDAGFRIFSPKSNDVEINSIHQEFIHALEKEFGIRFNIFSSSGLWSSGALVEDSHPGAGLFGEESIGPVKSMFSFEEIKDFPEEERKIIFGEVNPFLSVHANYTEVRPLLLKEDANISSPIIWVYLALLNKDVEVFDKVYPLARVALLECDDEKKQEVFNKYLQNLSNAESIDGIVLHFAKNFNGNVKDMNMNNFIDYLKSTTFFNDVAPMMGKSEKSKYLTVTDGSSESVGKQSRKMR